MGEVKVETSSTTNKVSSISKAGANIKLDKVNNTLEGTDIDPFTGLAGAIESLSSAISNYHSIIVEDAQAMQTAVDDFESNDQNIANQISGAKMTY